MRAEVDFLDRFSTSLPAADEVREQMPEELQHPPAGRYVLEPVDEVPALTDDEEAGIQAANESVRQGKGVSVEAAKARIDRIVGR